MFYHCSTLQVLPLDVRNWSSILFLAPKMVVNNCPDDHHAENQCSPIEVWNIWIRRNGEEHKDEEDKVEGQCSTARSHVVSKWRARLI